MKVLVTGGCGYVGSNIVAALGDYGYTIGILDNLATAPVEMVEDLRAKVDAKLAFFETDVTHIEALKSAVKAFSPDIVIHCAGLKSIADSWQDPLAYFDVNVSGTINLLKAMDYAGCGRLIFSSSATVYGDPEFLPITEDHPLAPINPYGRSKLIAEEIMRDWQGKADGRGVAVLRYFNPVGAHHDHLLGDNPKTPANNLFPIICQVLGGQREGLSILGDDYPTPDGTGERDYIHITDLSEAHIRAIAKTAEQEFLALNIGTGKPTSVKQVIAQFERHSNAQINARIEPRRPGDVATTFASNQLSVEKLGDYVQNTTEDAVASSLRAAGLKQHS